jgi:hypothetical protein
MYQAFPDSDYYDSPVPHASHQPQLVQLNNRSMKFPRSQDALSQSGSGLRYSPVQGEKSYVFDYSSFRSLRPQWKSLTYTPLARGFRMGADCFSLELLLISSYLPFLSHIAALR